MTKAQKELIAENIAEQMRTMAQWTNGEPVSNNWYQKAKGARSALWKTVGHLGIDYSEMKALVETKL